MENQPALFNILCPPLAALPGVVMISLFVFSFKDIPLSSLLVENYPVNTVYY